MKTSLTWCLLGSIVLAAPQFVRAQEIKGPVKATVEMAKDERLEFEGPIDPAPLLTLRALGASFSPNITEPTGRRIHMGHFPTFKIDGNPMTPGSIVGGKFESINAPLPRKGTKTRTGYQNVFVQGDLRITQMVELIPGKSSATERKRRMDSVLIRYTIENTGKAARSVGIRTTIDPYLGTTRNCKFAAPTRPGKILEAMELKGRDVPPYVQALQQPDLKNPGMSAYATFALGGGLERPDRVVLTGNLGRRDLWDLTVMAGGFSTLIGFFWEPREIRPGAKREVAYAYGLGIASPLSPEANFEIDLGGSFEIGKTFTISALISDPSEGQTLELQLPSKGIERVEGRPIQPVPLSIGEEPASMVLWKGRVLEYGRYPIQIRSNTGITRTAVLTVGPG